MSEITMRIRGHTLPGLWCGARIDGVPEPYGPVHVGIQRKREVIEITPGDVSEAVFEFPVEIKEKDGALQFHGPFVQRRLPEQYVYLSWGEVKQPGRFHMFRRAKLHLTTISPDLIRQVLDGGGIVEGDLALTDRRGDPLCASVRPPAITWSIVRFVVSAS
jgi:hypothetical protein